MKHLLIILSILFLSCGNESHLFSISKKESKVENYIVKSDLDSDKQTIWKLVAESVINEKRDKVTELFKFPLNSEFDILSEVLNKPTTSISFQDFLDNYDKIFNKDFKKSLKRQSFSDIITYSENDTLWFILAVGRKIGKAEGGLNMKFCKIESDFILKGFYGIGANFYYVEE